jgi:hypothetical protein
VTALVNGFGPGAQPQENLDHANEASAPVSRA